MAESQLHPLVRRLQSVAELDSGDAELLRTLPFDTVVLGKGEALYAPGARDLPCFVLLDGCILRYKLRGDGSRAIVAFELPGDIVNLESLLLDGVDCGADAGGPSRVAVVRREAINRVWSSTRRLETLLWRSAYIKAAALEEWLLNIGRRSVTGRLAHLFSELYARLCSVGLTQDVARKLHASPCALADAMALQQVIVTRSLDELASRNLIALGEDLIIIRDVAALARVGDFQSNYLHLT